MAQRGTADEVPGRPVVPGAPTTTLLVAAMAAPAAIIKKCRSILQAPRIKDRTGGYADQGKHTRRGSWAGRSVA